MRKLVTVTDRFRAASAGAGTSCWWTLWATGDLHAGRTEWFDGRAPQFDRGNVPAAWWDASPLKDVDRVVTPMLLFVGERDARNPWTEGALFHRALTDRGVPCDLWIAPGDGHGDWNALNLLHKANLEVALFERHLRSREYQAERAPDA